MDIGYRLLVLFYLQSTKCQGQSSQKMHKSAQLILSTIYRIGIIHNIKNYSENFYWKNVLSYNKRIRYFSSQYLVSFHIFYLSKVSKTAPVIRVEQSKERV